MALPDAQNAQFPYVRTPPGSKFISQRNTACLEAVFLHGSLLLLTFLTTTAFGYSLAESFRKGSALRVDRIFDGYVLIAHGDFRVLSGLSFSLPLLLILLAHEAGHYMACQFWRVDASLPYFLPSPLLLGTFGAFIRIRSPIYTRKSLFDIGASGPFAGFVALTPFLILGVAMSRVVHNVSAGDSVIFGTPLLLRIVEELRFGPVPSEAIVLHPIAMAAWTGLLATAMNLLPMGQLDGGHILYAAAGERWHRLVASSFVLVLVCLGFWYKAWWLWAVVMFLLGRRHPLVYDQTPLRAPRRFLVTAAFGLLLVSLAVVPVSTR